jgi:LytS/YehU family sensor histidine kinase
VVYIDWGFFCAIIVFAIIKSRIKAIRHESEMKQKIAGTEMMALRAQMNPHFIFNCLNSIDNLIQTDQKEKATDYLAKFAQLIRAILENSKNNTIPCWKDLEALELYLEMEKLRWDHKISCTLTIDSQIQQGDYKVPPMIVQPFIENAIHHGLLNKTSGDKKLDIDVHLEENNIKYTITDNGVGRQKAQEYKKINKPSQLSYGMQITKDRINLFNQDHNGSVKITDLYNAQHLPEGTKVEVWLTTQPITT